MSQSFAVFDDILPACDLCHSKKIRCNRQRNCSNCVDVGVECQRLRRGRTPRKRSFSRFAASVAYSYYHDHR
ncbi:hypothetical protein BO82DRAFT_205419 [Aspergillus uvarum CBS 121591]|uniref:Zn(2)-C6 fungal-type domain-containing protein n=1 Tax=Aspergillus uvarum CBS 121591 TaxID=1448315 RepID=A0A319BVS9_9EURO|nr:hypothetical protein BO82DRAFT_205419 [Aspergillus uvarum CBS 121591]PYH76501.1 hypothetical protein BO82DRAFT_205419 [Aspergillus uvarum CBS 121591]